MLTKEGKNLPVLDITAENYLVEDFEKGFYHCKLERKLFSSTDGSRLSRPEIQKFEPKGFERIYRNLRELGYDVEILYDPTKKEAETAAETPAKAEVKPAARRR